MSQIPMQIQRFDWPPFLVRWNTQDIIAACHVLDHNEYRLPDKLSESDVIVDIGAQVGSFAVACLRRGAGRVICFEPEPTNFDLLYRNLEPWQGKAALNRCAVWKHNGHLFLKKAEPGYTAKHYTFDPPNDLDQANTPCVTLDTILKRIPSTVRYLKLDCEGAELPILKSVTNLSNVEEVVGEVHYGMLLDQEKPTEEWLRRRLGQLGFNAITIHDNPDAPGNGNFFARRK